MATAADFIRPAARSARDFRATLDAEFDVALSYLLPDPVAHRGGRIEKLQAPLNPGEAACVQNAVERRVQEFTAGRTCARAALETLGLTDVVLGMGARRQPLWPESVVGSISHAAGYCVAAACTRDHLAGIGVDIEAASPLPESLMKLVCTSRERAWCRAQPERLSGLLAKFLFSAKESVFKCLYPLFGEELEFEDVETSLDLHAGRFTAKVSGIALGTNADIELDGRLACTSCLVLTAVTAQYADIRSLAAPDAPRKQHGIPASRPYSWCRD